NQTTNLDYLYYDTAHPRWVWIELKTDQKSVRPEQFKIYAEQMVKPMTELRDNVCTVMKNSSAREKYQRVIDALNGKDLTADDPVLVVISPCKLRIENWSPEISLCLISFDELLELKLKKFP